MNDKSNQAGENDTFAEGQWWLVELDAAVADGTADQKRAVAVVRNLLAQRPAQSTPITLGALDPQQRLDVARGALPAPAVVPPVAWIDPAQLKALGGRDHSASCAVWNTAGGSRVPLFATAPVPAVQAEQVETVAWVTWNADYKDSGQLHLTEKQARSRIKFLEFIVHADAEPLMTITQHNRIVAALAHQPAAQQAEQVPVDSVFDEREAQNCLFVMREIGSMDADDISGDDVDLRFEDEGGRDTGCDVSIVEYAERTAKVLESVLLTAAPAAPAQDYEDIRSAVRTSRSAAFLRAVSVVEKWRDSGEWDRDTCEGIAHELREMAGAPAQDVGALVEALEAILPFLPSTSASEGCAARHSENVRAADKVRAALAAHKGDKS